MKAPAINARVLASATVVALCALSLALKVQHRYGHNPQLYYGDQATSYPVSDAQVFARTALNCAEGRGCGTFEKDFPSYNRMPPGHVLTLAAYFFFLGNDPAAVGWCVAILTSLLPWLVYLTARRMWGGRGVACVAAALPALYPVYIKTGFTLMSEPTAIMTGAAALWLLARLVHDRSLVNAVSAGLVLGFAYLVRPQPLSLALAAIAWLFGFSAAPARRRIAVLAVFLAALCLAPGAWTIRNRLVYGRFGMPYTTTSVRQFWTGANPRYMPGFDHDTSHHELLWRDPAATELERALRAGREAREFVRADPLRYSSACVWRCGFMGVQHFPLLSLPGKEADHRYLSMFAGCALWLLAGIGCMVGLRVRLLVKQRSAGPAVTIPGWMWSATLSVVLLLFYAGSGVYGACERYRWPTEVFLFPFAALGIAGIARFTGPDSFSEWRSVFTTEATPRAGRLILLSAGGFAAALIAVFAAGMAWRYSNPPRRVALSLLNPQSEVAAAIGGAGLSAEFDAQNPRWITYADVFADRAANGGMLSSELSGRIVAWTGRVMYPTYGHDGVLRHASLTIDPSDSDIGGPTLKLLWTGRRDPAADSLKSGDIVTVIGRLKGGDRPRTVPDIEGLAILPGRFELR